MRPGIASSLALAAAFASLTAVGAAASEPTALVDAAVQAYTQALNTEDRDLRLEEFRRAERLFAGAAADGVRNADLYTNLGNAALQVEHLGSAVLAFRRALLVDPTHPRALQNLAHARSLLPEWVPRPEAGGLLDTFFFWHRTIPRAQRATAAAACFAVAGVLLAAAVRFRQTALRNAALLPVLAWAVLLGSVWMDPAGEARDEAVVMADEVVARAADSALAPSAFPQPLPGGVELRIVERRTPWLRVRLANGRDAWVSESSVTRVALPNG